MSCDSNPTQASRAAEYSGVPHRAGRSDYAIGTDGVQLTLPLPGFGAQLPLPLTAEERRATGEGASPPPWLQPDRPNPAAGVRFRDVEREVGQASLLPKRTRTSFAEQEAGFEAKTSDRQAVRDFNLYLAMLKTADTPLERAVVHGWYAPKRSAGTPQTRALRWLAEVEQLERSPALRQALQAAIRRKPEPGDSLQRARRKGLRLPPDIAARFKPERRRPARRAETLPLPLSFPAPSLAEERSGAKSVGLDVSTYSPQELRDLAVHWRLSAGRAERAAQQVVSPLYPDDVRVELRRRYGREAKYAHLLANQAQGLTRTGKTKKDRLIDISSLTGEELSDFQDFLREQAARAERDAQFVSGPDYPVEGPARDRTLALYRLQARIYTDLAEQLARSL